MHVVTQKLFTYHEIKVGVKLYDLQIMKVYLAIIYKELKLALAVHSLFTNNDVLTLAVHPLFINNEVLTLAVHSLFINSEVWFWRTLIVYK